MKHFLVALTGSLLAGMASAQVTATEPLTNIYDLEALLVSCQDQFLPIAPPSDDVYIHSRTTVLPIKWSGFPRSFKKGMVAEIDENDFPLYRVNIYEDVQTRETVFLNGMGVEVYRLAPEAGYNPYAYQMNKLGVASFAELEPVYDWWMDPAKVATEYVLIPSKLYEDYQTMEAYTVTTEADAMAMPMMMTMSLPETITSISLNIASLSNGMMQLQVEWPPSFTNKLEIYSATDLITGNWQFALTNISTYGLSEFSWIATDTNSDARFYVAGNADLDEDGDGLASAQEKFIYHTDPLLADSDNDSLQDGEEINAIPPTNPLDYDSNNNLIGDGAELQLNTISSLGVLIKVPDTGFYFVTEPSSTFNYLGK